MRRSGGIASEQWRNCCGTTAAQLRNDGGTIAEELRNNCGTIAEQLRIRNCSAIVPQLFRNSSAIVPPSFRNCAAVVPQQFRHCSDAIPPLLRNCLRCLLVHEPAHACLTLISRTSYIECHGMSGQPGDPDVVSFSIHTGTSSNHLNVFYDVKISLSRNRFCIES